MCFESIHIISQKVLISLILICHKVECETQCKRHEAMELHSKLLEHQTQTVAFRKWTPMDKDPLVFIMMELEKLKCHIMAAFLKNTSKGTDI
jgi:hypothetical protein